MEVWTENMVQAITDITVNQGIDPAEAERLLAAVAPPALTARRSPHALAVALWSSLRSARL